MLYNISKKNLAVLGTGTNVGKTTVVIALCRLYNNAGYKVTPFKAQNMSNNAWVTSTGGEISQAQAIQAEAARVKPTVDINPILLKPCNETQSDLIIHGKKVDSLTAQHYFNQKNTDALFSIVKQSLSNLQQEYDYLIIEGAGSCAEVNLAKIDITNCKIARIVDADVLLVADIDKGGVFAQVIGTLALLEPSDRARVKGILINKFRGDPQLFAEGVDWLEQKTGIPVIGVIPYFYDINLHQEDALSPNSHLNPNHGPVKNRINIAIIYLPHISNISDFLPLEQESCIELHYLTQPKNLDGYELVILPGTKSVIHDRQWLTEKGWDKFLLDYHQQRGEIGGICGGLQLLGRRINDPLHLDNSLTDIDGLDLFDFTTEFVTEKTVVQREGMSDITQDTIKGYEIHHGTTKINTTAPLCAL